METRMQSYFISFINIMHADVGIFLRRCFNVLKEMHRNFRTETKDVCLQAIFSNLQKAISNVVILNNITMACFPNFNIGLDSKF